MVRVEDVVSAAGVLRGIALRTPLVEYESLSTRAGGRVLVKAEHLQRTGSFKIRGAYVKIASLSDDERARGVVAASAGNHGQGVAWAASRLGSLATIVMPTYASIPKVAATRSFGAEVVLYGATFDDSLSKARALASERGAVFVHAFDDPRVIAGQGTIGLEIAQDGAQVARVLIPVGGGGLAAGVSVALRARLPGARLIGVRAAASPSTIADGAAVKEVGHLTGAMLADGLDDLVSVDDEAVSEAMLLYLEHAKQVVEGAGALALAALMAARTDRSGTSVVVASGGNVDPGLLSRVIRHGLQSAGRYLFVRVRLRDAPGELQRILALLAGQRVNVVSVVHHRIGVVLPVDVVEVELTLETRDRSHADEVLRALAEAGYEVTT